MCISADEPFARGLLLLVMEDVAGSEHHVSEYTYAPDICSLVITLYKYFRCDQVWSALRCLCETPMLQNARQAVVYDLHIETNLRKVFKELCSNEIDFGNKLIRLLQVFFCWLKCWNMQDNIVDVDISVNYLLLINSVQT